MRKYSIPTFLTIFSLLCFQVFNLLSSNNSGKIIVSVSEQEYDSDLYLINLEGKITFRLKQQNTDEYSPAWSPDGCQLAYVSNGSEHFSDIFVISADNQKPTNITESIGTNANVFTFPSWSPDGKKIAFSSNMEEGFGVFVLNLDDKTHSRLTNTKVEASAPDWSPDGTKIVFHAKTGSNIDIYTINIDGSDLRNLSDHPGINAHPKWSPNGTQIAFTSDRDGNSEIYVMDADGSNVQRLTFNDAIDAEPDWSPDGKNIAFSSERNDSWEIYVMDADGSNLEQITDEPFIINQTPRWQPTVCSSFVDSIFK